MEIGIHFGARDDLADVGGAHGRELRKLPVDLRVVARDVENGSLERRPDEPEPVEIPGRRRRPEELAAGIVAAAQMERHERAAALAQPVKRTLDTRPEPDAGLEERAQQRLVRAEMTGVALAITHEIAVRENRLGAILQELAHHLRVLLEKDQRAAGIGIVEVMQPASDPIGHLYAQPMNLSVDPKLSVLKKLVSEAAAQSECIHRQAPTRALLLLLLRGRRKRAP